SQTAVTSKRSVRRRMTGRWIACAATPAPTRPSRTRSLMQRGDAWAGSPRPSRHRLSLRAIPGPEGSLALLRLQMDRRVDELVRGDVRRFQVGVDRVQPLRGEDRQNLVDNTLQTLHVEVAECAVGTVGDDPEPSLSGRVVGVTARAELPERVERGHDLLELGVHRLRVRHVIDLRLLNTRHEQLPASRLRLQVRSTN